MFFISILLMFNALLIFSNNLTKPVITFLLERENEKCKKEQNVTNLYDHISENKIVDNEQF